MINTQPKQRFYIYPHIHVAKTNRDEKVELLLYNTVTGATIENNSLICCDLVDEVYKPVNLGVIDLTNKYLDNCEAIKFIKEIVEKDFGKILNTDDSIPKIVNLLPILNLQDDVERQKDQSEFYVGENALNYLNELNIYIDNQCNLNCSHCNLYYKQTKSCF